MNTPATTRVAAVTRHQAVLLARDPGPMIGYTVMGLLLMTVTRPLYVVLAPVIHGPGIDQAAAGMAVMFSLFALKVGAAHLLNERTWRTRDRLRASPAIVGEVLGGKALPVLAAIIVQQAVLFGVAAAAFGLHPRSGWPALAGCVLAWSACVLLLGFGASSLARSPAQLSAAGDIFALLTTVIGGALVPVSLLPGWLRAIAPASPGYWALAAYHAALAGSTAQLGRPLEMLAVFAAIGAVLTTVLPALGLPGQAGRSDGPFGICWFATSLVIRECCHNFPGHPPPRRLPWRRVPFSAGHRWHVDPAGGVWCTC